jgi:hypothetical protein
MTNISYHLPPLFERAFVGLLAVMFYRISEPLGRDKTYQLGKIISVDFHYLLPIIRHYGAAE